MLQNNPDLQQEYFALVVERYRKHFTIKQKKDEVSRLIEEGRFNDHDWLKLQAKKNRQQYGEDLGVFCLTLTKKIFYYGHNMQAHTKDYVLGLIVSNYFLNVCNMVLKDKKFHTQKNTHTLNQ